MKENSSSDRVPCGSHHAVWDTYTTMCAVADLWDYEVQFVGYKTLHRGERAAKSVSERNNGGGQIVEH